MSPKGPFSSSGDDDMTIVRPSPGWRRQQAPQTGPPKAAGPRPVEFDVESDLKPQTDVLADSALPLFMIVSKLRTIDSHKDVTDLRERLAGEIKSFQNRLLKQGASEQQVSTASYFMCSLIDEAVLNTPWGSQSDWGHDSLLVRFHREAWGGEEFFQTLEHLLQRPTLNLGLLELAHLCLSLGFEGKYRFRQDGLRELEKLRTELYLVIQRMRGGPEGGLSVNWQGMRDLRSPFTRHVPLWVLAVAASLLLLLVYLGFSYAVNRASNQVYGQWMDIASEEAKLIPETRVAHVEPARESVPPEPTVLVKSPNRAQEFREVMAKEIAQKLVEVLDGPVLRVTNSFAAGSDEIRKEFVPMLQKLGRELAKDKSRIEVIGHTDSQPINSARFGSNWDLSVARAKRVAGILDASGALGERITSKGRAEKEPVVPNDTPEHRAANRRVDIHVR